MALPDRFAAEVRAVVAQIPRGCVATYGQIARLVGMPGYARPCGACAGGRPGGRSLPPRGERRGPHGSRVGRPADAARSRGRPVPPQRMRRPRPFGMGCAERTVRRKRETPTTEREHPCRAIFAPPHPFCRKRTTMKRYALTLFALLGSALLPAAAQKPLYIVNGRETEEIASIPPEDIERVETLPADEETIARLRPPRVERGASRHAPLRQSRGVPLRLDLRALHRPARRVAPTTNPRHASCCATRSPPRGARSSIRSWR